MSKKEQDSITSISPLQLQKEQQEAVNKALDQTRDNIKKTISEARKDIPEYAQRVSDFQERAVESAREITDNYIESQKEIINAFQSVWWAPYIENVVNRTTNVTGMFSPARVSEIYTNTLSNFVNNFIAVTRLANTTLFANAELFNTSLQQTRDSAKEFSKIGVNAVNAFHQAASDIATTGFSALQSVAQRK
jgi:hypothetical protein